MMQRILAFMTVAMSFVSTTNASQLEEKMAILAQRVLAVTNEQPISVGMFVPTRLAETNVGLGFETALTQELTRRKPGVISDDPEFEVQGNYAFVQSRVHTSLKRVVKVSVRIIDLKFGQQVANIPFRMDAEIDHTNAIATVVQPTVALPPEGTKAERNQILADAVAHPSIHIHGPRQTLISSQPESLYAMEVLVKRLGTRAPARARTVENQDGLAFVNIDEGEMYEIRLHNRSNRETSVKLSVDGLDMFHFSQDRRRDGSPRYSYTVLPPQSTITVVGWHHSIRGSQNYKSFLVTSYGAGAFSREGMKARGKLGVIHAQFAFSRAIPEGARAAPGKETGFGPPRTVRQQEVEREFDTPHDFISVRYSR